MAELFNRKFDLFWIIVPAEVEAAEAAEAAEAEQKECSEQKCLVKAVETRTHDVAVAIWAFMIICCLRFWQTFILKRIFSEYPGKIRPPCTTMPWTIWPALVVLWGVCWMFYSPITVESSNTSLFDGDIHGIAPGYGDHPGYPVAESGLDTLNWQGMDTDETWLNDKTLFQLSEDFSFPFPGASDQFQSTEVNPPLDLFLKTDVLGDGSTEMGWNFVDTDRRLIYETSSSPVNEAFHFESSPSAPSESTSGLQPSPSATTDSPHSGTTGTLLCPIADCHSSPFASPGSLNRHIQRRHKRDHRCDFPGCQWSFSTKNDLNRHRSSIHKEGQAFFCPHSDCQYSKDGPKGGFPRLDKLRDHNRRRHQNAATKKPLSLPHRPIEAQSELGDGQIDPTLNVAPEAKQTEVLSQNTAGSPAGDIFGSWSQPCPDKLSNGNCSIEEQNQRLMLIVKEQCQHIRALERHCEWLARKLDDQTAKTDS